MLSPENWKTKAKITNLPLIFIILKNRIGFCIKNLQKLIISEKLGSPVN